jgi:hypothetical protein
MRLSLISDQGGSAKKVGWIQSVDFSFIDIYIQIHII